MATLSQPHMIFPENIVTHDDTINFLAKVHADSPHKDKAFKMIENSTIDKRHLILPLNDVLNLGTFDDRGNIYSTEARKLASKAASNALNNASVKAQDISMVIVTSCTGFMMPSLTAHLINDLHLPDATIQLPLAQVGCVAGASAINRAAEHCKLNNNHNVLIVALEISSLCFQPQATRLQDFITTSLFGDGVGAVVMKSNDNIDGFKVAHTQSHFMRNTEDYIMYTLNPNGFHFSLDKDVMHSIEKTAPSMENFIKATTGKQPDELDFYVLHTGGRRILSEVERCLRLRPSKLLLSRECLRTTGNTSSVAVIDVLQRHFEHRKSGESGFLAAFGPGFTTEMSIGEWVTNDT